MKMTHWDFDSPVESRKVFTLNLLIKSQPVTRTGGFQLVYSIYGVPYLEQNRLLYLLPALCIVGFILIAPALHQKRCINQCHLNNHCVVY